MHVGALLDYRDLRLLSTLPNKLGFALAAWFGSEVIVVLPLRVRRAGSSERMFVLRVRQLISMVRPIIRF